MQPNKCMEELGTARHPVYSRLLRGPSGNYCFANFNVNYPDQTQNPVDASITVNGTGGGNAAPPLTFTPRQK